MDVIKTHMILASVLTLQHLLSGRMGWYCFLDLLLFILTLMCDIFSFVLFHW